VHRLFKALRYAADGSFVVDEYLRIIYWNNAAEEILGFSREDAINQFCYKLLQGCDQGNQLVCKANCQIAKLTLISKPIPNQDLQVLTKQGSSRWVNMIVFPYEIYNANHKRLIVHLFHNLKVNYVDEKFLSYMIDAVRKFRTTPINGKNKTKPDPKILTPRELEVLTALVKGNGTGEIAELLSISPNTVRNHIQNILQKFQAHTRLEAVAIAINHDLIDRSF